MSETQGYQVEMHDDQQMSVGFTFTLNDNGMGIEVGPTMTGTRECVSLDGAQEDVLRAVLNARAEMRKRT